MMARLTRMQFLGGLAAGLVAGGSGAFAQAGAQAAGVLSPEQIARILAAADRTAADRTNDLRRKPQEMLAFIGLRPGMVALDISSAGGYTTELLARAVGPTGAVFGQGRPPPPEGAKVARPAQPEGNSHPNIPSPPQAATSQAARSQAAAPPARRPLPEVLAARAERMKAAGVAAAPITAVIRPFEDPVPPELVGKLDVVTLMFNYHDLGHLGVDRAPMNAAVFKALRPGGMYVIADHAGRPGTGISEAGTLHRIEEAFLRKEVEVVGFRLRAEGMFLRNPNDPRDKNTPDPPQPKDEFVLKFVRP